MASTHAAFPALAEFREALLAESFSSAFAFTPLSSYHMTIFEGVIDLVRKPDYWPSDLPFDAPLGLCHRTFLEKLEQFDLGSDPTFRLRLAPREVDRALQPGAAIMLVPADAQEETKLRTLRDRLSVLLKLRHPGHDRYKFHITQTYRLKPLNEAETQTYRQLRDRAMEQLEKASPVIALGPPHFTFFDDMFEFRSKLVLRNQNG